MPSAPSLWRCAIGGAACACRPPCRTRSCVSRLVRSCGRDPLTHLPAPLPPQIPKNILMVGPTGCGKTEIARRLAKLCKAPFVKVEATKFTEVGYHGRDVDTIIKDLMDASLTLVRELKVEAYREEVKPLVEARIIEALTGPGAAEDTIASFRGLLHSGALEDREIVIDVPVKDRAGGRGGAGAGAGGGDAAGAGGGAGGFPGDIDIASISGANGSVDLGELMRQFLPNARGGRTAATTKKAVKVRDARGILLEAEVDKRLASVDLRREAVT